MALRASIFFSYPTPWATDQDEIVERVRFYLEQRGFEPRTLGVTDYDMDTPLQAVRRLMLECNGLVTIALRRTHIAQGVAKRRDEDGVLADITVDDRWLTTPWPHIETAMAFQLGLPILVFRERGVVADGILEPGVVGAYMPEIDSEADLDEYFSSPIWTHPMGQWEGRVRRVIEQKGQPPSLYR
jgi:hypothetical protein